jgi:hypothetical protein
VSSESVRARVEYLARLRVGRLVEQLDALLSAAAHSEPTYLGLLDPPAPGLPRGAAAPALQRRNPHRRAGRTPDRHDGDCFDLINAVESELATPTGDEPSRPAPRKKTSSKS